MSDDDPLILTVRVSHSGEDPDTHEVLAFLKRPGDRVQRGEGVVELHGIKVVAEFAAPADGVIVSTIAPNTEVRVGDPLFTLRLDAPLPEPVTGKDAPKRPVLVTDLHWGGEPAELPFLEHREPYPWGLWGRLGEALLNALLTTPELLRGALRGTDRVAMNLGLITPGSERWWRMALWPGAWQKDASTELHEGPDPEALVTVLALSGVAVERAAPPRGLVLVLRPPPYGAPAGPWDQAWLGLTLDGAPLPEHHTPFVAALMEQLKHDRS